MPYIAALRPIFILVALATLFTACGSDRSTGNGGEDVDISNADVTIEMAMRDMAFFPAEIVAAPGETVAIVLSNPDTIKHDFKIDDIDGESVHVELQPRQETTFLITMPDEPGEWRFYCTVPGHESLGMEGWIIVT